MARSKQNTIQPNETQGANTPALQAADLREQIRNLQSALDKYSREEAARVRIQAEYHRLDDKLDDSANPVSYVPTEKVKIEWLVQHREECRRARVTIPDSWDTPLIFAKGDEQLGHVTCDEARVIKDIAWAKSHPQCLIFLLGDAIDAATKTSPGSIRENSRTPLQQIEAYIDLHKSVADRIIGYVGGNHERRIDKALDEGGGAIRLLAKGLSSEDHRIPYSGGILLIDLVWRGFLYTFTLFHGAGAAATPGSKIQRMQRNMLLTESMITLSGHLHEEAKTTRRFMMRLPNGDIKIAKHIALQCGTYLQYLGSYGEVGGMAPVGPDMILIELLPDGKYHDMNKGEAE